MITMRICWILAVIVAGCRSESPPRVSSDAAPAEPVDATSSSSPQLNGDASDVLDASSITGSDGGAPVRRATAMQDAVQIAVLLNDDLVFPYADHAEKNLTATDPTFWRGVLARCPTAHLDRAWKSGLVRPLGNAANAPGLPSLNQQMLTPFFEMACPPATDAQALITWLKSHPKIIADAWRFPRASDP